VAALNSPELHSGRRLTDLTNKISVYTDDQADSNVTDPAATPWSTRENALCALDEDGSEHPLHLGTGKPELETQVYERRKSGGQGSTGSLPAVLPGSPGWARCFSFA